MKLLKIVAKLQQKHLECRYEHFTKKIKGQKEKSTKEKVKKETKKMKERDYLRGFISFCNLIKIIDHDRSNKFCTLKNHLNPILPLINCPSI